MGRDSETIRAGVTVSGWLSIEGYAWVDELVRILTAFDSDINPTIYIVNTTHFADG